MRVPDNACQFDSGPNERWLESDARHYAGWMASYLGEDRKPECFNAYVRPGTADWYDLWPFPTWWQAMAFAMQLADEKGYYYEGANGHGLA